MLKKIPVFITYDQAMTDVGVQQTKILLRPDEADVILRVSLSQVYEMTSEGDLQGMESRPKRVKSQSVVRYLKALGAIK